MPEILNFILLGALKSLRYIAVAMLIFYSRKLGAEKERPENWKGKLKALFPMAILLLVVAGGLADKLGTSQECQPWDGRGIQDCETTVDYAASYKDKSIYFWAVFLTLMAPYGYGVWQKERLKPSVVNDGRFRRDF